MKDKNLLLWAAAIGGFWFAYTNNMFGELKLLGRFLPGRTGMPHTPEDIDNLTRLLLTETDGWRSQDEMIGIVQANINRAKGNMRRYGMTAHEALMASAVPPGKPNWNASEGYRNRWERMDSTHQRWDRTYALVSRILSGGFANPIGARTGFLHPEGMPVPNEGNGFCKWNPNSKYVVDTFAGRRCLPKWSTTDVVTLGKGRFSTP